MNHKFLDDLSKTVSTLLESAPAKDLERNVKATLTASLSKLDMATREELDMQERRIAALTQRIDELEKRLAALETPSSR